MLKTEILSVLIQTNLLEYFWITSNPLILISSSDTKLDDGFSTWKMVIGYENNDELVSFFIADNVTIE